LSMFRMKRLPKFDPTIEDLQFWNVLSL
jgi:hypothetical protein